MKARLLFLAVMGCAFAGALTHSQSQNDTEELPSPVIYPPQRIALRMDHSHPQHVRLRCERCHEGATDSTRSAESLIPREASCAPCHDAQTDRERPSACTGVHGGSDAAASAAVGGASDNSRAAASASTSSRAPSTRRS